jgi:hypothetical protein
MTGRKGLHSLQIGNPGRRRDFDILCWNVVKRQEVRHDISRARARLHEAEPTGARLLYPDVLRCCQDGEGIEAEFACGNHAKVLLARILAVPVLRFPDRRTSVLHPQ